MTLGAPHDLAPDRLAARARKDLATLRHHDVPTVRSVRRRYSKLLKEQPAHAVVEFALALSAGGCWEERLIAYEVVAAHRAAAASLNERQVAWMAKGLEDWGTVDLFGVTILGPAWREGQVSDTDDRSSRAIDGSLAPSPRPRRHRSAQLESARRFGGRRRPAYAPRLPATSRRSRRHGREGAFVGACANWRSGIPPLSECSSMRTTAGSPPGYSVKSPASCARD